IVPWLAESIEIADNSAIVTLKEGICFSNGNAVTADMVKRNFERLIEKNKRFLYMGEWIFEASDEKTLVITTAKAYPTFKNDLATPEMGIMDLDNTTDFDKAPICTGPFVVSEFIPKGDVTVVKNENYWGGEVKLNGAVFYAMSDDQSKLMAMQNGEIDGYDNISATDIEIFGADTDNYTLSSVAMQMRVYAFLNSAIIPDSVRAAITLVIDRDTISSFMSGMITPTNTAFDEEALYGKATAQNYDLEKAKEVLEEDGYVLNNGVFEKDGKPITVEISCYASRWVDTIALLMQEQLTNFGIKATINLVNNPDSSYMTHHNYEIAIYRMITDKTGDPMPFIDGAVKSGSYQAITGFANAQTDALIEQLRYTVDAQGRATLTNEIMTQVYNSNTYLFIARYNRNAVLRKGASGFSEFNPYEFYGITAETSVN
ncbi:MAG: ABC transporter substrate-binding protein, partial [Anaerotignaceae bacterium]